MARDERETGCKFTFVDMKIRTAKTAGIDANKDLIGLNSGAIDIPVLELPRGVVNNSFHFARILF